MINEREIIFDSLFEILEKKQYSHIVLKAVLDKYDYLPKQQRSFIKRVCEGTIEQMLYLDYVINQFSKTKTNKMKPLIRTLLRMGTYQILFMDSVPDSAACNEAVKLAAKRGFSNLKGFVNGVLRSISRQKDEITYPDREKDESCYLSIRYSMPLWIVNLWLSDFGSEKTEEILKGLLVQRPVTIRVRESLEKAVIDELLERMKQAGITLTACKELPYAYFVTGMDRIELMPGYEEGYFVVQDIGSMQVVEQAGIRPESKIYDVCAAPGGKAIHAADKMKGTGMVIARDLSEDKTDFIEENIERLSVKNVKAAVYDATVLDESAINTADVVIADLPCSGLGVIGRKSDIKYRITKESVEEISALQKQILKTVSQYVKVGGTLMYSTCTITKAENEENRDYILKNLPFTLEKELQLLPGIDQADGFYMAKFIRKE